MHVYAADKLSVKMTAAVVLVSKTIIPVLGLSSCGHYYRVSAYVYILCIHTLLCTLAVWLSGNALASINVVALRQTRLVPGWVTVCGRVNHFGSVCNQLTRPTQPFILTRSINRVPTSGDTGVSVSMTFCSVSGL